MMIRVCTLLMFLLPGLISRSEERIYYLPHIASEWSTFLYVENLNAQSAEFQLKVYSDTGDSTQTEFEVSGSSSLKTALTSGSGGVISTESEALSFRVVYIHPHQKGLAEFTLTSETNKNLAFLFGSYLDNGIDITWQGIAFFNFGATDAEVTLTALDASGIVLAEKELSVAALTRVKGLLSDWFPGVEDPITRVLLTSDQPAAGVAIQGHEGLQLLFSSPVAFQVVEFPAMNAGSFTTMVTSHSAGTSGIAVRVFYPETQGRRYEEGAPVVVVVPGGHKPGTLSPEGTMPGPTSYGYVNIEFLYPGGSSKDGYTSGGTYDYRGPKCIEALKDVMLYALGKINDEDGLLLTERIPFAMTSNVGMAGMSHGGNAALVALGEYGDELKDVQWLLTWESPVGDQCVTVELNGNPYYVPGTATPLSCPVDGMEDQLRFDSSAMTLVRDPFDQVTELSGALFLDSNGNGVLDRDIPELMFRGLYYRNEEDEIKMCHSVEMASLIEEHSSAIFGVVPWPSWMAGSEEVDAVWYWRDGARRIPEVCAANPDLMIMALGTEQDHVQTKPDHPHIMSFLQYLQDLNHDFWRLNPDAVYCSLVSGVDVGLFDENDANTLLRWPDNEGQLVPETVSGARMDRYISDAGILEMADRVYTHNRDPNLIEVLVP